MRIPRDLTGKELIKEQKKRFVRAEADEIAVLRKSGSVVRALCHLEQRFETAFFEAKRAKNLVDYDDLAHFTLEALNHEEIEKFLAANMVPRAKPADSGSAPVAAAPAATPAVGASQP